jgi:hypothetical protein
VVRDAVAAVWDEIGEFTAVERDHDHDAYPIGVDADAAWHDWLLRTGRCVRYSALRVLRAVRASIRTLPPYKALFSVAEVTDLPTRGTLPTTLFELCGSWRVPGFFSDGSGKGRRQFVNPNHANAAYYTEVYTRCECGALMHREATGRLPPGETQDHSEDCLRQWRLRARARLCEKRREVAERCLELGRSIGGSVARLGLHDRSSLGGRKAALGIRQELLDERRKRMEAATFARLAHFYDHGEIADAFGYSRKTVGKRIGARTNTDGDELRQFRRDHGYE